MYTQTEYSMLESSLKIDGLVSVASQANYKALAITDNHNMHGVIKFYEACKKYGIHPIIGLKIRYEYEGEDSWLLLYAMDNRGYLNLMKIASRGKVMKTAIDLEFLRKTSRGILAVIPSEENRIVEAIFRGREVDALTHFRHLEHVFDLLYLGIAMQSENEIRFFDALNLFCDTNALRKVGINKTSFLDVEDIVVFKALQIIEGKKAMEDATLKEKNSYFLDVEEAMFRFSSHPELLEASEDIAKMCDVKLDFATYHLPKYPLEEGASSDYYLQELCKMGLNKRLLGKTLRIDEYKNRLLYELGVIKEMGFSDYFLIVWDFIKYAKNNKILVGPGRGSAPASLVSYSLGITDVDPIEHELLFERFLNPERITMPDIDLDFPDDQRETVIKYVGNKYGKNRVSHIVTFGTFAARSSIRDMARVFKLEDHKLNEILKLVPNTSVGKPLKEIVEESREFKQLIEENTDIRHVIEIAIKLEGLPRHTSTHAAGIIITKDDMVNYTPVDEGLDDIYQTQYEASDLEKLGLLKMDFLGLRNLTIIDKVVKEVQEKINPDFKLSNIDFKDQKTYALIANADTTGIFQLESSGMRNVLRMLKTSTLDDIIVAIALFRPGPMEIIPTFIRRKFNHEAISYPHPDLEEILKNTYGTIVYQEQIMLIARKFAGYSLGEADILRRAVSKKSMDSMQKERANFIEKSMAKGYSEEDSNTIYDYIVKFANYGFNKPHSVAYAVIAYQMAYLKVNFFKQFMTVLLSSVMGSESTINDYINESVRNQVMVLSPSVNKSEKTFVSEDDGIRYPFSAIQNIGVSTTNDLLEERKSGLFTGYKNFILRTKGFLSKRVVEALIYGCALDEFHMTKKQMIEQYDNTIRFANYGDILEGKIIEPMVREDEFGYEILQSKEKEVLGVNIKYNFFRTYYGLREQRKLKMLKDISDISRGSKIEVLVMVRKIKEIQTKNKDLMAFLELYDDSGEIEAVMFPNTYDQFFKNISKHVVMIALGMVERRNEKLQFVIDHVEVL